MDLAVTLVKTVVRAFYTTREILVIDALILHEALRDDDLAYLLSTNTKDLHKWCANLRDHRFLAVQTRPEQRSDRPGTRPSLKTWYYINYRQTIDAIKWRVYTIDKEVQGTTVQTTEKKEYFCKHCKAEWTAMEVLDNWGPSGFLCHRCGYILTSEPNRHSTGHEQSTRLNNQFKFITEQLREIDQVQIPECDFDRAFAKAVPVERDATHQRIETIAVDGPGDRPMAVKGLTNTGPQTISVNISATDGPSKAEQEAELARKEQAAKQNALPSFFTHSTISGEAFSTNNPAGPGSAAVKTEVTVFGKPAADVKSTEIDEVFEKLKAEQAAALARASEEEEEDGSEEDEDEFEDVPATGVNSATVTPSIATPSAATPNIKRETSEDDERQTKRVKIDTEVKQEPVIKNEPKEETGIASDEDEDDDLEFEDV